MKPQFPTEQSKSGEFQRQEDAFREWISTNGSTPYPAVAGRYHLYISYACPWASRTVIFRSLKGLEQAIGMTVVDPIRDEKGWAFRDPDKKWDDTEVVPPSTDPVNGFHCLSEAYAATDPNFDGRVTVPVLWDKVTKKIVNNCEDDICRMFNDAFNAIARNRDVNFFPKEIEEEHTATSTTAFTKPATPHASARTKFPARDFSTVSTKSKSAYQKAVTCSTIASSKPIGVSSAHSLGSTSSIMATSSATFDASSITQTCKAT